MEYEDDILAKIKFILWCYTANSFPSDLPNHLLTKIGLFTLHNCFCLIFNRAFKVIYLV